MVTICTKSSSFWGPHLIISNTDLFIGRKKVNWMQFLVLKREWSSGWIFWFAKLNVHMQLNIKMQCCVGLEERELRCLFRKTNIRRQCQGQSCSQGVKLFKSSAAFKLWLNQLVNHFKLHAHRNSLQQFTVEVIGEVCTIMAACR